MFKNFKENFEKFFIFSLLFLIGMFVFLSLITHDQVDNDYFKYNSNSEDSKNLLGFFGAVVSGFLYDIFGHISYLIPIFLVANSFNLIIWKRIILV